MEGTRAVGVRYRQGNVMKSARCTAEVLLSAGSIQSPQLLQLSGIGPRGLLEARAVPVVVDAPEVGENLQDHLQLRLSFECTRPITTNDQLNSWWGQFRIGLQWLVRHSGPLAVGINQGGCFMRALVGERIGFNVQVRASARGVEVCRRGADAPALVRVELGNSRRLPGVRR
jgi:choline dehydrogenase